MMLASCLMLAVLTQPNDRAPNLALAPSAVVSGPRNASGSAGQPMAANDGQVIDYGPNHGYAWGWFEEPLTVRFPGQRVVNEVELLLLDVDPRAYDFRLEVSEVEGQWRAVAERSRAAGWVTLSFPPIACKQLRLVFTGGTLEVRSYHVVEIAAYHAPDPEGDSPLRAAWLASRATRARGQLDLLGVEEALNAVFLNEAAFARAKALPEDERRWIDSDGDRDPDLVIFRDQGALIVAIDDDDDAPLAAPQADRDSDCWVVDLNLDGRPDRVFDYFDDDGDGDVDREHHYYLHFGWFGTRPGLVLVWDYNDNNQTWVLDRHSYDQGRCQWQCDFGGNEGFSIFVHDPRTQAWEAEWECPFYFYDPDADGLAEEAVRLEGYGRRMQALRYSLNADDDGTEGQPYDYDCALVALGPVELPETWLVTEPLRTGRTGPYLPWETARDAVRKLPWARTLLVWDEDDCNIDPADAARRERWEGIINSRYHDFPQVGGPACGLLNKRYELDTDNSGGQRLYTSAVDGRMHLYGAERGTLWIDADRNRRADGIVEYRDTDSDGFFDEWQVDENADGTPERTFRAPGALRAESGLVPWDWRRVAESYRPLLRRAVDGQASVAAALGLDLTPHAGNGTLEDLRWALENRIRSWFASEIAASRAASDVGRAEGLEHVRASWEAGRFEEAVDRMAGTARGAGRP